MAEHREQAPGKPIGFDLTVADAEGIRDFYSAVIGWESEPLEMGGYADYFMKAPGSGDIVAGIVHARGVNAGLPPYWLAYFGVTDLDASLRQCTAGGGKVVSEIMGDEQRYCVIQDPAGAYLALIELPATPPD